MKSSTIILLLWITFVTVMQACEPNGGLPGNGQGQPPISDTTEEENTTDTTETTDTTIIMTNRILIQIGNKSFEAQLEDNATAQAFVQMLPLTLQMEELNGNEKYSCLPESLPTNSERPGRIETGDLMLFGNNCLVLFYQSFSTGYSYTRIGKISNSSGLEEAVGRGDVSIRFSAL